MGCNFNRILFLLACFIAPSSFAVGSEVEVVEILEGSTLYLKEKIDVYAYDESGLLLGKKIANNIQGRHGAIRLTGIKIEPYNENIYSSEQISGIGIRAYAYIKQQLSDPNEKWFFMVDDEWKDSNGLPQGYLINEFGKILNIELVAKGYSCYYFKNGYSPKFHDNFWKAERLAFNSSLGIWSQSPENLDRRIFYFWERRKWADTNWKVAPPTLKIDGITIDNVGEKPNKNKAILGGVIVAFILLVTGRSSLESIAYRKGVSGMFFNLMMWKFNPCSYVLKIPVGLLETYGVKSGCLSQEEIYKRREKKEKKKSKLNKEDERLAKLMSEVLKNDALNREKLEEKRLSKLAQEKKESEERIEIERKAREERIEANKLDFSKLELKMSAKTGDQKDV